MMKRVALLVAVAQELGPLKRRLGLQREGAPSVPGLPCFVGRVGETEVLAAAGGVGARRAAAASRLLLDSWEPGLLVMAGVAGALSPRLRVGDVLAAEEVETSAEILVPSRVPRLSANRPEEPRFVSGRLLSIDRVLITAAEKQDAGSGGALAVEMETAGLVGEAIAQGIPWGAVRAISDVASESLPLDFNRLRDSGGDLPVRSVALEALRRPGSIPGLLRLSRNTGAAAEALASFLDAWLRG
jgi:adenosylhomocysteine nucleosidase